MARMIARERSPHCLLSEHNKQCGRGLVGHEKDVAHS